CTPTATAARSWSTDASGPSVSTVAEPPFASTSRTASSTAHSSWGLTVKPRYRVSISRSPSTRRMRPAVAGTRLTQTRTFMGCVAASSPDPAVLRIEQRPAPGDGDRDGVPIAEVLDQERLALAGQLGGEVGHQQVLPDRRARPRARDVGPPPFGVLDRLAVRG